MGRRCVRKRIGMTAKVAVVGGVEGVRTRARALAIAAAEAREKKRTRIRKVGGGVAYQLRSSSSYNRTRRRRRRTTASAEEDMTSADSSSSVWRSCVEEANCWREGGVVCEDDHDEAIATAAAAGSCCSSSSAPPNAQRPPVDAPLLPIQDPENDDGDEDEAHVLGTNPMNFNCRKRRRITPSTEFEAESAGMDPVATLPSPDPNDSQQRVTAQRMPSEDSEIEEFFAAAEKDLHQRFRDKYNYDVVKDVPLQGRYQWVPVNP